MADGMWRITRLAGHGRGAGGTIQPLPNKVDEIRVWWDPETDAEVPRWDHSPYALAHVWPDGRIDFYPWISILKAEYTPPTREGNHQ